MNQNVTARSMSLNASLMRGFAAAMDADLAVSPLVIVSQPGMGSATLTNAIAKALFEGRVQEFRCAHLSQADVRPLPVLTNGEVVMGQSRAGLNRKVMTSPFGCAIILDQATSGPSGVAATILKRISEETATATVVVLIVHQGEEEEALKAVQDGLGLHKALVPTVRLSIDPSKPPVEQPVMLVGQLQWQGSKSGERYMSVDVSEGYDHEVRFTILAKDGQTEEDFSQAVDDAMSENGSAVRLRCVNGSLECTTDDIIAL